MIFWTWAKGLEDEFDGSNGSHLRYFFSERPTRTASPSVRFGDNVRDEGGISEMNRHFR